MIWNDGNDGLLWVGIVALMWVGGAGGGLLRDDCHSGGLRETGPTSFPRTGAVHNPPP